MFFFFFFASSLYEGRGRKTLSPNQKPTEAAFWPWLIFTSVTSYNFKTISLYALFPPPNVSFHSIMNLNAAESCGSDLACKNVSQSKQDVLSGLECSNHLWITGLVFAKWKAIWLAKKKKNLWGYLRLLAHRENGLKLSREKEILCVCILIFYKPERKGKKKPEFTALAFN